MTFLISASGTGSCFSRLIERVVLIISNRSVVFAASSAIAILPTVTPYVVKSLFSDASKWWVAGKLLSTGPARPACREPVEALK